jgi:hypothetical protein
VVVYAHDLFNSLPRCEDHSMTKPAVFWESYTIFMRRGCHGRENHDKEANRSHRSMATRQSTQQQIKSTTERELL